MEIIRLSQGCGEFGNLQLRGMLLDLMLWCLSMDDLILCPVGVYCNDAVISIIFVSILFLSRRGHIAASMLRN